jgi:hypothetical protein
MQSVVYRFIARKKKRHQGVFYISFMALLDNYQQRYKLAFKILP